MSRKLKFSLILTVIILLIPILIINYYLIFDRESKEPQKQEKICNIETIEFQGRKVFVISPKQGTTDLTTIYFHGGSYITQATENHWKFIQKLAIDANTTVIMPDYPLIPKYNYKDVFEMVEPLYKEIIEKVDINKLIIMGDSAGGGLALALEEKLSQEKIQIPEKTILISPWLDVRLKNSQIDEFQEKDKQLNKESLKIAGDIYSNNDDNYLISPIEGDISKLKNITIFIGTNDILNPDVHLLIEKGKKEEINIELKEYENAGHIWMIEENSSKELVEKGYLDILDTIKN